MGKIPFKSNGVGRIILGAALTLSRTLSPIPAQAQTGSWESPAGDETLVQGRMGKRFAKMLRRLRNSGHEGHSPAEQTLLDGTLKSPKTVPSPAALHLAIEYRLATFSEAIKPVKSPAAGMICE